MLLLEEAVAELAQLRGFLLHLVVLHADLNESSRRPIVQNSAMDPEAFRDLREGAIRIAVLATRITPSRNSLQRLRHEDILPGQPSRPAMISATCSFSRPERDAVPSRHLARADHP